jgi:hypothetical protein
MDGTNYDLGTLLMAIGMERAENIETQVLDQANAMKARNKKLERYSQMLAAARGSGEDGMQISDEDMDYLKANGPWPIPGDAHEDGDLAKETTGAYIELLKGKMDSLNSDSQMDMIRLQGLMSKRDTVYQSITNLMKKDESSKNTIVANYR